MALVKMKNLATVFLFLIFLSSQAQDDRKVFVGNLLDGIEVKKDIRYNTGERPLLLDIYFSERDHNKALPCVVWIHGGSLTDPSLDKNYDLIRWGAARTARKGYVSVSVDYRLVTERPLPAAIEDCATAIRFLKSHAGEYGIDTARMAVVGESAGGYLAGMLSFTCNTGIFKTSEWSSVSNQIACGVLWYPAICFHPYHMPDYISPDDIPVISIHGDNDDIVPLNISQKIKDKCNEKGLTFELHVIKGADHGFVNTKWNFDELNRKYTEQAIDITISFLDKQLNNK